MADTVKSRTRILDFVPGEHVWVHATYFDDPKQPVEMRYSASLNGETQVNGIIRYKTSRSYMVDFKDGSSSVVSKDHINSVPKRKVRKIAESNDEQTSDMQPTPNLVREENESDQTLLHDNEEVYLCHLGKDVFKASYQHTSDTTVHGQTLDKEHGRFYITKALKDANRWKAFNVDKHCVGAAVMWHLKNVWRMMRKPFSEFGTEAAFATPLVGRRRKRNETEWQKNKKKRITNSGIQFDWKRRKGVVQQFGCERKVGDRCQDTCRKQCNEIDEESRQEIHSFWKLGSHTLQRGFLLDHVKAVAKQRERKRLEKKKPKKIVELKTDDGEQENAIVQQDNKENQPTTRNRQYSRVYSLTTDNGRKAVCQKFFLSTVDIDEKRVCTALKTMSSDTGAVGPDGRGYHKKHHTDTDRENVVIEHIWFQDS